MSSPVLGGRKARRLEWTGDRPISTAEGRTHGNVSRLHVAYNSRLFAGQFGLEPVREDSVFLAAQKEFVSTTTGVMLIQRRLVKIP